MREFLQILKVQVVKMKPELSIPLRGRSENDPGSNERRFVLQNTACRASAISQKHISCQASLKK